MSFDCVLVREFWPGFVKIGGKNRMLKRDLIGEGKNRVFMILQILKITKIIEY